MKSDSPEQNVAPAETASRYLVNTTVPKRTHDHIAWLLENADYNTKTQILMDAIRDLHAREYRVWRERNLGLEK